MAKVATGVFPAHFVNFKINKLKVADVETLDLSIDGNVEEWDPYDAEGWKRRIKTGQSLSISVSGKRNIGDPGNDYVASKSYELGQDATTEISIEFPDGAKLEFDGVINVTNPGLGGSLDVAPLEFEVLSDGKPTYTPAA